jgi:HEAT repeat protein
VRVRAVPDGYIVEGATRSARDGEKASQALLALGPAARKALEAARKSDSLEVARRAADCLNQLEREAPYLDFALREYVRQRQVEGLRALLRLKDPAVRLRALEELDYNKADPAQLVPLLLEALDDPDYGVGSRSYNLIWVAIQPQQFSLVLAAAKDKRPRVRSRVFNLFRKFPKEAKTALPLVLDALQDENAPVRRAAAGALGFFGSEKEVLPALLKALEDPDESDDPNQLSVAAAATLSLGGCRKQTPTVISHPRSAGPNGQNAECAAQRHLLPWGYGSEGRGS